MSSTFRPEVTASAITEMSSAAWRPTIDPPSTTPVAGSETILTNPRGAALMSAFALPDVWPAIFVRFEAGLLEELGFGLDALMLTADAVEPMVARQGALLSQFPAGAPGLPGHFPARNRTIAGLALGVVVVEAAARSGALITAGFAGDLGREVFAVPGRISSAASAGAHRLIQDGAKLVTCWQDVVQELPEQWRRALRAATTTEGPARPCPESDEGRMLDALTPDEPQHIERLIVRGGLPAGRAAAALVTLELGGLARQLAGQRWMRTAPRAGRG